MPDPTPAQSTPATGTGAGSTPAGGSTPTPPAYVTPDQMTAALQTALQPIQNALGQLLKPPAAPGKPAAGGDGDKLTPAQQTEIDARLKEAERQLSLGNQRIRSAGIREAAAAAGIPADRHELLELYVERHYGAELKINDAGQVVRLDALNQATPIGTVVANLLKQPEGMAFRPPVDTPRTPRGGGDGNGYLPAGQKPYSELSEEERMKLQKEGKAAGMVIAGFKQST